MFLYAPTEYCITRCKEPQAGPRNSIRVDPWEAEKERLASKAFEPLLFRSRLVSFKMGLPVRTRCLSGGPEADFNYAISMQRPLATPAKLSLDPVVNDNKP